MSQPKQKILLFGPIGDFGGRELEIGFIASVLSSKYDTAICSTGIVTEKSQVFDFYKKQKVFNLKELLSQKFTTLKLLALFSFLKNGCKGKVSDFVNNALSKRYFDYDNKLQIVLDDLVGGYEAVFIVAQLSSSLVNDVIRIAKNKNKKVFFRTTGTINFSNYDFIDSVDYFIHHSISNANKIENAKHKYEIIDQCAYNESELLRIPFVECKVNKFLTLGRLEKEKNIDIVIKGFLKVKEDGDLLYVVGSGSELKNLKQIANNDKDIIFTGFIKNNDLYKYFSIVDCVIIPHYELETGPLTGIESMAASRLIISAYTGAMPERIPFNIFWINNSIDDISKQILSIKTLTNHEVLSLSKKIRDRYFQQYSIDNISNKYLKIVNQELDKCE